MNPYIKITRPDVNFLSAFGALVGAIVAGVLMPLPLIYAFIAVFLVSAGGIVINDYYDSEIDKINAPHRPIPSGKITRKSALYLSLVLFIIGIAVSSLLNIYCLSLAVLNTFLEIAYAYKLKQIAVIGNIADSWFVASTFLFGALINFQFAIVWVLSLLSFLSNMGREIIGDVEDVEGDKKIGCKTLPIVASEGTAMWTARILILAAVLLSFLPYVVGLLSISYLVTVLVADVLFIYSLFQTPRKNQKITKVAMLFALLAFLIGALV